jgi:hypothetical protein
MAEPFPPHPIYDQMRREWEERDRPLAPSTSDPPTANYPNEDDTTETTSV